MKALPQPLQATAFLWWTTARRIKCSTPRPPPVIEELPRFHEFFTPALAVLNRGNTMRSRDIVAKVSDQLGLTAEQRSQVISSGQRRLDNRVAWALNYLFHAQAVRKPSRGVFQITDRGRDLALAHPDGFGVDTLGQFEEFRAFKARSKGSAGSQIDPPCAAADAGEQTPLEQVSAAVEQLDADVAAELVQRLHCMPPRQSFWRRRCYASWWPWDTAEVTKLLFTWAVLATGAASSPGPSPLGSF